MSNLEQQAKQLLEAFSGVSASSIDLNSSLSKDLGLDSLKMTALSKVIEQVAGIKVSESSLSKFKIVGDVVNFLKNGNVKDLDLSNISSVISSLSGQGSLKDKLGNVVKEQGSKMVMDGLKNLFG